LPKLVISLSEAAEAGVAAVRPITVVIATAATIAPSADTSRLMRYLHLGAGMRKSYRKFSGTQSGTRGRRYRRSSTAGSPVKYSAQVDVRRGRRGHPVADEVARVRRLVVRGVLPRDRLAVLHVVQQRVQ